MHTYGTFTGNGVGTFTFWSFLWMDGWGMVGLEDLAMEEDVMRIPPFLHFFLSSLSPLVFVLNIRQADTTSPYFVWIHLMPPLEWDSFV